MQKLKFYCDLCKEEVAGEGCLHSLTLPTTIQKYTRGASDIDCCSKCFDSIKQILETNFLKISFNKDECKWD